MDALLTCCVEQTRCHLTLMSISTSILPVECYTSPNASQRTPRGLLDTFCQSQLLTMASLSLAVGSPSQSMLFVTAMDQYSPAIHMKPLSMNQSQPAPVYCKYRPQMLMEWVLLRWKGRGGVILQLFSLNDLYKKLEIGNYWPPHSYMCM